MTGRSIALAGVVALAACGGGAENVTILEGATLLDGSGGSPIEDAVVVVRGGTIEAVARVNEIEVPRKARVVRLVGKTIIPGLIDAHAHVEPWTGPRFIAWGVTTVRDLSDDSAAAYGVRAAFNADSAIGPRVFTSGGMIDGSPPTYPGAEPAATAEQGRRAVDRRAITGVDWIKLHAGITPEVLAAILDEAATFRLPVAAHLGRTDALTAARAGAASIEHFSGLAQIAVAEPGPIVRAYDDPRTAWRAEVLAWSRLDSLQIARAARALAETRVSLVPTLVAAEVLARLADPAFAARPAMADVPLEAGSVRDAAAFVRRLGWTPADGAAARAARDAQVRFLVEFRRAGGLMGAGSDAASPLLVPGFSLHEELALLVAAGFAPASAIATATRRNAQLLGADSLGWIAPGKVADLLILNSRPDSNILATRDIHLVMTRGRLLAPDSLRATWRR